MALAVRRHDREALNPQARNSVVRRDDAAIDHELLFLGLNPRLEVREVRLDLRVRLLVDSARGLQDRELSVQVVRRRALFHDLLVQRGYHSSMVDCRIARLVTAELEAE